MISAAWGSLLQLGLEIPTSFTRCSPNTQLDVFQFAGRKTKNNLERLFVVSRGGDLNGKGNLLADLSNDFLKGKGQRGHFG
jgi:hypothetical protein